MRSDSVFQHALALRGEQCLDWHGTCCLSFRLVDVFHPGVGSVNCDVRSAKLVAHGDNLSFQRGAIGAAVAERSHGLQHGAARNGYRKRSHDYVACGVTIRPRGEGTTSSHGHFGRLVGRWFVSSVVEPVREDSLRRGRLSRGPEGRAAALICRLDGFVRMSAPSADGMARATRPSRCVVNRAIPVPATSAGVSGGWTGCTPSGPRTRLRTA